MNTRSSIRHDIYVRDVRMTDATDGSDGRDMNLSEKVVRQRTQDSLFHTSFL